MKLFTCTDHDSYWPFVGSSIVIAEDEESARALLSAELVDNNLAPHRGNRDRTPFTLQEIDMGEPGAIVLVEAGK